MIVFNIFVTVVLIFLLNYCWKRRNWYRASWNLPGIFSLPIIGGAYVFRNTTDIVGRMSEVVERVGSPLAFWMGPLLTIGITNPEDVEIVINHPSSIHKGGLYEIAIEAMGAPGLLTASGRSHIDKFLMCWSGRGGRYLFAVGFETSAVSVANTVLMLAMHPEYQGMVYQEIQKICPNIDDDVTGEELKELLFTERCIKESMRLIPTVPVISRLAEADFYIGKTYIPAGCEVVFSLYELHRNKNVYGNDANTYNPDRFLPERFEKQHPYSYLPYSAGLRNCIGKKYAQTVIRMFIVWLVRNFKFTTDLKFEELSFKWMVVLKTNQGYPVRVEKRLAK